MSLSELFLGMIALATLVMALVQLGAAVVLGRMARETQRTLAAVRQDVKPLVSRVSAIADEAAKTAGIASAQAAKIDHLVADLTRRIEETSVAVQRAVITPAREGLAVVAALKAALGPARSLPGMRPAGGRHADEEDPLFIG